MIADLLDSVVRPDSYRRFAAEKASRTASFIAFLSMIYVGGLGVEVRLRLAPMFAETFSWLETAMPPLLFAGGTVTSTARGPVRLEHPRFKEIAVTIDTARTDPVTPAAMADAKVIAYLTANALYLNRGGGQIEAIDLSKSPPERPFTVDGAAYKELAKAFDWLFYPALMLFFFLTFAASLALCGLLYALLAWIASSLTGASPGFARLLRIGVHAQTAGSLLYALDAALPRTIPYFPWASAALSLAYLWLGARAAAGAGPETTASPAA